MFKTASRRRIEFERLQAEIAEAEARDRAGMDDEEPYPFPPPRLRYRVGDRVDRGEFAGVGKALSDALRQLVSEADPTEIRTALDFGCGCGRTLRYVRKWLPDARICGTDIDPEGIAWCRDNLGFAEFAVNGPRAPMAFPDAHFDFIYGISVFTHLDEDMQHFWLGELRRVARPGALVILSVAGAHIHERRFRRRFFKLRRLRRHGFLFKVKTTGRFKLDGLPDCYQAAYHTRDYVERVWSEYFDIAAYIPRGMAGHQDAVLLRR